VNPSPVLRGVPVFPLPGYYVFPGTVTPLHIFETRYRQMMSDLMDSTGRFVMAPCAPVADAAPLGQAGPVLPELGALVEIVQTEELEDGRWLILLLALARVTLAEVPSDRLYRRVDARIVPDREPDVEQSGPQRTDLVAALQARSNGDWGSVSAEASVGQLADLLLHALPLQPEQRHLAFTELDAGVRAGMALAWHAAGEDESPGE
jgi:Lon protease-like protein